jgi:hypothetical protein
MTKLEELFERKADIIESIKSARSSRNIDLLQEALIPLNTQIAEHAVTKAAPALLEATAESLRYLSKGRGAATPDDIKELAHLLTRIQSALTIAGDERALLRTILNDD